MNRRPEKLRAVLYPSPAGPEILLRAINADRDLHQALAAARRIGTPYRVRRSWTTGKHQGKAAIVLRFELLMPRQCRQRAFYLTGELFDAWLGGCALGLSVRPEPLDAGADVLTLWPRERPRSEVADALAAIARKEEVKAG